MITNETSDRLEDRLQRLAELHGSGELDDNEYRAAKGLLLQPPAGGAGAATGVADASSVSTVRTLGPLKWGAWWFIALVIGFFLACLSSAVTTLQAPAGPLLCRNGDFVAGNVSERYGSTTSYNIDSACVTTDAGGDAHVEKLSQFTIVGVLWFEYMIASFALIAVLVWVMRGLRGPPRPDAS